MRDVTAVLVLARSMGGGGGGDSEAFRHGQQRQRGLALLPALLVLAALAAAVASVRDCLSQTFAAGGMRGGALPHGPRTRVRRQQRISDSEQLGQISRADKYERLTQRDHVLRRPDMYIGPLEARTETTWTVGKLGNRLQETEVKMSPGFLQIFNEILVNAVDRQFDVGKTTMTKIDIIVDPKRGMISIENDGGSMPVVVHPQTGLYVPTLVFGEFLSGDNFDDSRVRFVGGRNGVGAKATNVFSKQFVVEVNDPASKQHFMQRWHGNMESCDPPEISKLPAGKLQSVKISYWPDLERFGLSSINKDHMRLLRGRAYDAASCTHKGITVHFNGKPLDVHGFEDYAKLALGPDLAIERVRDLDGTVRAEVAVAFARSAGFSVLGLVNGLRCNSGTHVNRIVDQLTGGIRELLPTKQLESITASTVKRYIRVAVKVLVDRPDFDSQTKTRLTTTAGNLGFDLTVSNKFVKKVADLGVFDAVLRADERNADKKLRLASSNEKLSMAKLDDARDADKKGRNCTLILTEGDSAKALAVAGLSKVGRQSYGIFPLKGKLLNPRTATRKQLIKNAEIKAIAQIVGLEWGRMYTAQDISFLRYQRIMIFSDQDLDGHHIAGLVINFIHSRWPSLLQACPDFIQRFATPIVKVFPKSGQGKPLQEFFTQSDFTTWQEQQPKNWSNRLRIKYYKGLGTSTRREAIEYFSDMERHVLGLQYSGDLDDEAVERAFEPKQSQQRKDWIQAHNEELELDYAQSKVSLNEFFDRQFVHFSIYDNKRSIPLLMDGLKPSQRKVLYVARGMKVERKLSDFAGKVSEATSYHHGEAALVETIVNLAQAFVGTNNVNLLAPNGMFGTRLKGRSEHSSGRYLYTQPAKLTPFIFMKEDDEILRPSFEDGKEVEPLELLPIIPMVLLNGCKGIGTGWATDVPNYNPLEVTAALEQIIRGQEPGALLPWYNGFTGTIEVDDSGQLYSCGRWRLFSSQGPNAVPDTVEVKELPIGMWTDDFIEHVEDFAEQSQTMLTVYKCRDHDDERVHLLIGFSATQLQRQVLTAANATEAMGKLLGLRKRILANMRLFHAASPAEQPRLMHFQTPAAIIRAFYSSRHWHYVRRKEHLLRRLAHQIALSSNRQRFIQACDEGSLQLGGRRSLEEMERLLEDGGYQRLSVKQPSVSSESGAAGEPAEDSTGDSNGESSYEYLLNMPFRSLTRERAEELDERVRSLTAEEEKLKVTSVEDIWLAELSAFRKAYEESQASHRVVEPILNAADNKEAQKAFNVERRRLDGAEASSKSVSSPMVLLKQKRADLQSECMRRGIRSDGTRSELVQRLLGHISASYTLKEWNGLTVRELQAYLTAFDQPSTGQKEQLIERLVNADKIDVPLSLSVSEMKEELAKYGLKTSFNRPELAQRLSIARARKAEQERSLGACSMKELQQCLRLLELPVGGAKRELIGRLVVHEVAVLCRDLGVGRRNISARVRKWQDTLVSVAKKLGTADFTPCKEGSPFYSETMAIFNRTRRR